MRQSQFFFIIKICALLGIILALYLLWEQLFHPVFQPCNINGTVNCNAIISGDVAKTLGLPTPLYGLVGYIVIFFAAIFQKKKLLLGMATFGLLFCLWIAYRELFQLHVICPACLLCDVLIVIIFTLAISLQRQKNKRM